MAPLYSKSSHTSDFHNGSVVASLPGARQYRVSSLTCWPDVGVL